MRKEADALLLIQSVIPSTLYQSYLVRLWQAHMHATWRASAQHIQTGETMHFATLDSLYAFLQAQIADHNATPDAANPSCEAKQAVVFQEPTSTCTEASNHG